MISSNREREQMKLLKGERCKSEENDDTAIFVYSD